MLAKVLADWSCHPVVRRFFVVCCLFVSTTLVGCDQQNGPLIDVDLGFHNLCAEYNVSGQSEARCDLPENCPACPANDPNCIPFDCWHSSEAYYQRGFCRQCGDNTDCPNELPMCDNGWCTTTCSTSSDCASTHMCTDSFCRRPHFTDFNISNVGSRDLEIDTSKTELIGAADACGFARWEWSETDNIISLAPGDDNLFLRVAFTPPDVGQFRAVIYVYSNADNYNPLPILLCGQALEASCHIKDGDACPECTPCTEEHFLTLIEDEPKPDCSAYN